MKWLPSIERFMIVILGLVCGCANGDIDKMACFTGQYRMNMYYALQAVWPKYVANSISCYSARGLAQYDEGCREAFDCLRRCGFELEWVYRLTDWFLLEARNVKNGGLKYFRLGLNPQDGGAICRPFDLKEKFWINVCTYAGSLRFAPIVVDTRVGFTEMWDSMSDMIVNVPIGFHALIQGGCGVFLLRKDSDGGYYRWNAMSRTEPERWPYYFPIGYNPRSSFFIALSLETGKSYAFAVGLEPVPNSEGALAISPCGAYKGRQYYEIWKGDNVGRHYYAWPERDRVEPLSNGTESFGGRPVVARDGRIVVLLPTGMMDVSDADWSKVGL